MEKHLIQFSSVVVGRAHNPSILNPDFLGLNGIVPREWNWEVAEAITTPPLAVVRYSTGIAITVEHNKLQVVDVGENPAPENSKVSTIIKKYIETLPHVTYVAVGNNFQTVVPVDNPGEFLKSRFLKSGPWDAGSPPLREAGIRLVYTVSNGRLVLSLDTAQTGTAEEPNRLSQTVVLSNGNFHRECEGYPAKDQVLKYLDLAGEDYETYERLLARVLDSEGKHHEPTGRCTRPDPAGDRV